MAEQERLYLLLKQVDFFSALSVGELELLLQALEKKSFRRGTIMIRQDEPGDSFYLISSGRMSVWVSSGLGKRLIAWLGPEEFFGEMALVDDSPRHATVVVDSDAEVYVLRRANFRRIFLGNPILKEKIEKAVSERSSMNIMAAGSDAGHKSWWLYRLRNLFG